MPHVPEYQDEICHILWPFPKMNLASLRDIVYVATGNAAITALQSFYTQVVDAGSRRQGISQNSSAGLTS